MVTKNIIRRRSGEADLVKVMRTRQGDMRGEAERLTSGGAKEAKMMTEKIIGADLIGNAGDGGKNTR